MESRQLKTNNVPRGQVLVGSAPEAGTAGNFDKIIFFLTSKRLLVFCLKIYDWIFKILVP